MTVLTDPEILVVLMAIEAGKVTCVKHNVGFINVNPVFEFSNGWKFTIFDDCGEWDYIERAEAGDGRSAGYRDINHGLDDEDYGDDLSVYRPSGATCEENWGGLK